TRIPAALASRNGALATVRAVSRSRCHPRKNRPRGALSPCRWCADERRLRGKRAGVARRARHPRVRRGFRSDPPRRFRAARRARAAGPQSAAAVRLDGARGGHRPGAVWAGAVSDVSRARPLRRSRAQRSAGGPPLRPEGTLRRARAGAGRRGVVRRACAAAARSAARGAVRRRALDLRRGARVGGDGDRTLRHGSPSGRYAVRSVRAALSAVCAFAVAYLVAGSLRLPTFAYDPIAHAASFTADVRGVSMRYYGDLAWACAAGSCAAAVRLGTRRPARPVGALTGAALSLIALDVVFYLSRLFARV